jgi:hypothetical protein
MDYKYNIYCIFVIHIQLNRKFGKRSLKKMAFNKMRHECVWNDNVLGFG